MTNPTPLPLFMRVVVNKMKVRLLTKYSPDIIPNFVQDEWGWQYNEFPIIDKSMKKSKEIQFHTCFGLHSV